jgi:tetratricopeptide (TPR) repeat protein
MKKIRPLLIITTLLFPLTPTVHAACSAPAALLIGQALSAFKERMDLTKAQQALDLFEQAAASDSACLEAHVKGSRAAWWVADHATTNAEKAKIFQKGIDFATAGVALDGRSAESHFWMAANMGSYGEVRGVLKSLALVKPIRHELNEIISIDPAYDHGAAYRVLGVVDYKVPGFAGGSKKRALENLTKSLEMGPQVGFNRYYMAEYFWTVGDKTKALEQLAALKNLTATDDEKPELLSMQKKGEALEAKLTGKKI